MCGPCLAKIAPGTCMYRCAQCRHDMCEQCSEAMLDLVRHPKYQRRRNEPARQAAQGFARDPYVELRDFLRGDAPGYHQRERLCPDHCQHPPLPRTGRLGSPPMVTVGCVRHPGRWQHGFQDLFRQPVSGIPNNDPGGGVIVSMRVVAEKLSKHQVEVNAFPRNNHCHLLGCILRRRQARGMTDAQFEAWVELLKKHGADFNLPFVYCNRVYFPLHFCLQYGMVAPARLLLQCCSHRFDASGATLDHRFTYQAMLRALGVSASQGCDDMRDALEVCRDAGLRDLARDLQLRCRLDVLCIHKRLQRGDVGRPDVFPGPWAPLGLTQLGQNWDGKEEVTLFFMVLQLPDVDRVLLSFF